MKKTVKNCKLFACAKKKYECKCPRRRTPDKIANGRVFARPTVRGVRTAPETFVYRSGPNSAGGFGGDPGGRRGGRPPPQNPAGRPGAPRARSTHGAGRRTGARFAGVAKGAETSPTRIGTRGRKSRQWGAAGPRRSRPRGRLGNGSADRARIWVGRSPGIADRGAGVGSPRSFPRGRREPPEGGAPTGRRRRSGRDSLGC